MVRTRIERHKVNPAAVDSEFEENAFDPIEFIIG